MADRNIAALCSADKTTLIYGLIDPRTQELRYVGKTVLRSPERRLFTHLWRARTQPHKRHSMAWLLNLERAGIKPDAFIIEEVAPGGDWVEAEQFWIEYFRFIGADLCNHTIGGEGVPGLKRLPETIAKLKARLPRGERHHQFGKPMPEHVREALARGNERLRADPVRNEWAKQRRLAGITPDSMALSIEGLRRANADPIRRAESRVRAEASLRTPEARKRVSEQSTELWATKRTVIIAAQNAGKGEEWSRKQSVAKKQQWKSPGNKLAAAMARRRRLSETDVIQIRARAATGESQQIIARDFDISPSMVSLLKSGKRRR